MLNKLNLDRNLDTLISHDYYYGSIAKLTRKLKVNRGDWHRLRFLLFPKSWQILRLGKRGELLRATQGRIVQ